MQSIRSAHNFNTRFHFCEISGTKWTKWDIPLLEASTVAVDALRHKRSKEFHHPLCCKLAVMFYPKKSDISLYGGVYRKEKQQRHDETVLRMLLKGAAHYLYSDDASIMIRRIVSDGDPRHRPLDSGRIVWQMLSEEEGQKSPLRDYVSIADNATIDHVPSNHREHAPDHGDYRHAHYLQLADMLLGAIIHACHKGCRTYSPPALGSQVTSKRDIIATPVKIMLEKRLRRSGFRHSGHYRSFTISQISFEKGSVLFKQVSTKEIEPVIYDLQRELDYG